MVMFNERPRNGKEMAFETLWPDKQCLICELRMEKKETKIIYK